jgi:cysteine desulfurase/selenocysteine lyase
MKNIPHINIIGPKDGNKRCGIVTFTVDGVHPHDVATLLSEEHIAIRAGHHCAQPLHKYLGKLSTSRASLAFYNNEEDIDAFVDCLGNIRKDMGFTD